MAAERNLPTPTTLIALLIAGQVLAWTLAPALTHTAPPLDVVEGYMWGREWVLATYKHPALPSWVLETSRIVTGATGWPAYLVSQLFVSAAFVLVYLLGRDLMGEHRAAAGTLLLTGVAYYAWPTTEFNHNIAEMPFWAGLPFALWRAVERRSFFWWILAGIFAAGGMYAKFTTALLLLTAGAWILIDAKARSGLAGAAPWIGLVTFLVLIAPLGWWLSANEFQPLQYAARRTAERSELGILSFLFNVALNVSGMLAMLAIVRQTAQPTVPLSGAGQVDVGARETQFLLLFTLGPLVLALVGALLAGTGLKTAWGSSMFNLIGLVAIAAVSRREPLDFLRPTALLAAAVLTLVPLGYAMVVALSPRFAGSLLRANWPQAEIARRMQDVWARETGRPLKIVAGDNWLAGLVGLTAKDKPSIFTSGNYAYAPWITPARLKKQGALVVWNEAVHPMPPALAPLIDSHRVGREHFNWRRSKKHGDLVISYGIIPPD